MGEKDQTNGNAVPVQEGGISWTGRKENLLSSTSISFEVTKN